MRHLKWYCVAGGLVFMHALGFTFDPGLMCRNDACQASGMYTLPGNPGHGRSGITLLDSDSGDPTPTPTPTTQPEGDPGHGGGGLSSITLLDSYSDLGGI